MREPLLRPPSDDDVAALVELERARSRELGIDAIDTDDDLAERWRSPRFDRERHERVAVVDGRVVAGAHLIPEGSQAHGGGYVLPTHRGRGIGRALVDFLVQAVRAAEDLDELHLWADVRVEGATALYASVPGAEHLRTFLRMVNKDPAGAPDAVWPDGIRLLSLEGPALVDAVVEAHDGSFVDHWNFVPLSRDEMLHWLSLPAEDPALWFVAAAGRRVAGFNLCHVRRLGNAARGYIGPLGTVRGFRGRGLATAMLRHGLRALAERGVGEVMLGVDAENPHHARGLYERNGFIQWSEGQVWRVPA